LWFGYFGSLNTLGQTFCDVTIEQAFSFGPTWPSMGLTLLVNQFQGNLHLQLTHLPAYVPATLAETFLDMMISSIKAER
jgi:hypothetical protein